MDGLVATKMLDQERIKQTEIADNYALNLYASIYFLCFYISQLASVGGRGLENYFQSYPFLKAYFNQITTVMPHNLDWKDGISWWSDTLLQTEQNSNLMLPLQILRKELKLRFASKMALMLAGLVEEDSRFGTLFSELQQPLALRRPMLETLGHIVRGDDSKTTGDPWEICNPLISHGLVQAENIHVPRVEWVLKVNSQVWDLIRGSFKAEENTHWYFRTRKQLMSMDDLVLEGNFRNKLESTSRMFQAKNINTLVLRAPEGSHSVQIFGAIARELNKSILVIESSALNDPETEQSLGTVCTILNALPVIKLDLAPGETADFPKLRGFSSQMGIILGENGGLDGANSDQVVTLSMSYPGHDLRVLLWHQCLAGHEVENLLYISSQFRIPGDYIRVVSKAAVTNAALEKRDVINIDDIRIASRNLNRQKLDTLADPIEAKGNWSHLITADTTSEKLDELHHRCIYREQLLKHLGPAFANSSNCGVRALFIGRSGTGKTLAAKILASEVGMDIYRVDLASIVNKYIGETEKNLHTVLTRAEALDVILLLDEGDALLGSRTDVKNANDRYANLETNYLLQRLENYQGVVVITTNLADNIDKAFQRRMDIVIPFFQPQMEQRLAILNLHLPDEHEVEYHYLEKVSKSCILMGGQIRNVCLHASLAALAENVAVNEHHLELALRSEYRKNGGTFPMDISMSRPEFDGGMETFMNALMQNRQFGSGQKK